MVNNNNTTPSSTSSSPSCSNDGNNNNNGTNHRAAGRTGYRMVPLYAPLPAYPSTNQPTGSSSSFLYDSSLSSLSLVEDQEGTTTKTEGERKQDVLDIIDSVLDILAEDDGFGFGEQDDLPSSLFQQHEHRLREEDQGGYNMNDDDGAKPSSPR